MMLMLSMNKSKPLRKMCTLWIILLMIMLPISFAVSINPQSIQATTTATSAAVTFETDTPAEASAFYGKSVSSLTQIFEGVPAAQTHSIAINNLDSNDRYYYQLKAEDESGVFTTNYLQFITLPETPANLHVESIQNNNVNIVWDPVSGRKQYNIYLDGQLHDQATQNEYTFAGLSYNSAYTVAVTAVNTNNLESQKSTELTFTTGVEPVEISFVQVTDISRTSAKISWKTNKPATSKVFFGTSASNLDKSEEKTVHETDHMIVLQDLEENTNYYYKIISSQTEYSVKSFKTLSEDPELEFSAFEVADITINSAEINWQTNIETKGVLKYSIDDSFAATEQEEMEAVNHHVELTELLGGMVYYYKVVVGNTESEIHSFTTSESLADFIDLYNAPTKVKDPLLRLQGKTAEHAKLYVFVNRAKSPRAQVIVDELPDDQFEVVVTLDANANMNGIQGNNIVEIFSWNKEGVKSIKVLNVVFDASGPTLSVNPISTYVNARKLTVSGLTEPSGEVEIFLGESSQGAFLADAQGYFEREVDVGTATTSHLLRIVARDTAGNENVYEKEIFVDNKNPTIKFFTSFAAPTHYKLFRIDGQTKQEATVTVQNFGEYTGCIDQLFIDKYGTCKEIADVHGPGPDFSQSTALDPASFTFDLGKYALGQEVRAKADDVGNFSIVVPLMGPETDYYGRNTKQIGTNTLTFNVTDLAGNTGIVTKTVKYNPGCVDWRVGKVTSIPANIYTEDMTIDNLQTSAIIELDYIGGGTPQTVVVNLVEDNTGGQLITENVQVPSAEQAQQMLPPVLDRTYSATFGGLQNRNDLVRLGRYKATPFDANKRKIYIYAPIAFEKYAGDIEQLPKDVAVYLTAKISYKDSLGQVANCDVFPVTSYVIQKPENVAKWLSPEMINQSIKLLDGAINITERGVKFMTTASRWTTVACGAMVVFNYASGITGSSGDVCSTNQLKNVYAVCDRILCPAIPPKCEGFKEIGSVKVNVPGKGTEVLNPQEDQQRLAEIEVNNEQIETKFGPEWETYKQVQHQEISFNQYLQTHEQANKDYTQFVQTNGLQEYAEIDRSYTYETTLQNGQKVTIEYYNLDDEINNKRVGDIYNKEIFGCENAKDVQSVIVFRGLESSETKGWPIAGSRSSESQDVHCVDKPKEQLNPPTSSDIPGCYNEECPYFDDVKCAIGPGYNLNPANDLFASLQCGCFPGAKGHLENLLKILTAAKKCMEQAKIGETTAGYCERVMGYFVCDILTEVFKFLFRSAGGNASGGFLAGLTGRNINGYKDNAQQISSALNTRYGDIVKTRLGLSTDQLVNKACVAAFASDWSILEGAIDQVVESVEVAPVVNVMASSRPYGFDPFTSRLNIGYNLYVGIVPGGNTKVDAWLACDPSAPGNEFCMKGTSAQPNFNLVREGRVPGYLTRDDFFDQNIFVIDDNTRSWYNKIVIKVEYNVGGKTENQTLMKPITKKGDISAFGCHFDPLEGFECDIGLNFQELQQQVPGGVQLYSNQQGSTLVPQLQTFFPGNAVSAVVKLRNDGQQNPFLRIATKDGIQKEYALEAPRYAGDTRYYLVWLETNPSSTSSSTSSSIPPSTSPAVVTPRQTTVNVLQDSSGSGQGGDTPIYSGDTQRPLSQGFSFAYSFASAATQPQPPAIAIVEPVSVFDQQPSHYVNVGGDSIPLGFVVVDDENQFSEVTITIESLKGYYCSNTYAVQGSTLQLTNQNTQGVQCQLELTQRTMGIDRTMESDTPAFIEFNLKKDGTNVKDDPDDGYEIAISAKDAEGNAMSNPIRTTLRINPQESQYAFTYEDMLLCLGSGCSGSYIAPVMQVKPIVS